MQSTLFRFRSTSHGASPDSNWNAPPESRQGQNRHSRDGGRSKIRPPRRKPLCRRSPSLPLLLQDAARSQKARLAGQRQVRPIQRTRGPGIVRNTRRIRILPGKRAEDASKIEQPAPGTSGPQGSRRRIPRRLSRDRTLSSHRHGAGGKARQEGLPGLRSSGRW